MAMQQLHRISDRTRVCFHFFLVMHDLKDMKNYTRQISYNILTWRSAQHSDKKVIYLLESNILNIG